MADIDVGAITEALNDKVDRDFNNVSETGKTNSVVWGIPDYSAGVTITASDLPFTAPSAGFVVIVSQNDNSSCQLLINGTVVEEVYSVDARVNFHMKFVVDKGDVVSISGAGAPYGNNNRFYPFKGA